MIVGGLEFRRNVVDADTVQRLVEEGSIWNYY